MTTLEEFITATNNAPTQEHVFDLFRSALAELGYDRVLYSLLTDHPSLNLTAGHGVIRNYPEDWMQYYTEKNYVELDPVIKQAFETSNPYTWNQLVKNQPLRKVEKRVMDECNEAKLLDGAAIAIYGPKMEIAGVGLASSTGGINPSRDCLSKIKALASQFHMAYTAFDVAKINAPAEPLFLTPREKEILCWTSEGKSSSDIGGIYSISEHTVNFHIKNIFRKLDCTNKTQAVLKAYFCGLINPSRLLRKNNDTVS